MPICGPIFCTLGHSTLSESPRLDLCAVRLAGTIPKRELLTCALFCFIMAEQTGKETAGRLWTIETLTVVSSEDSRSKASTTQFKQADNLCAPLRPPLEATL